MTLWTSWCFSHPLTSKYSVIVFSCLCFSYFVSYFFTSYIFPGVGLGCIVSKALTVTDEDMYIAAVTLASCVTQSQLDIGNAYPPLSSIRDVRFRKIDIPSSLSSYLWTSTSSKLSPAPEIYLAIFIKSLLNSMFLYITCFPSRRPFALCIHSSDKLFFRLLLLFFPRCRRR